MLQMQHVIFVAQITGVEKSMNRSIPHFSESIFYLMEQIAIYLDQHGKNFFNELSEGIINSEEFRTIDVIVCNPDICQRDLAKLILRDRVRTGRILDSLENKGIIKRFGDIKNNRLVKKMELTEQGKKIYDELIIKIRPHFAKLSEKFSEEQYIALRDLLKSLKNAIADTVKIKV